MLEFADFLKTKKSYMIQLRAACHDNLVLLHLPRIFTSAAAFFRPLCNCSLALKSHSSREHVDDDVSFSRF